MKTRPGTYTAATPASLVPEALTVKPIVPVSGTKRRKLQSCTAKTEGNRGSKNKCITGLWAPIPLHLLQEILSRLGLKANIQASAVCKAWCEAAVSVRKLQPRPLLFHSLDTWSPRGSSYFLADSLRSQTCKLDFPELKKEHSFSCSRDGWLLVGSYGRRSALLLNPFTRESFYLPHGSPCHCLAFSAAPTSASCMVITYLQSPSCASVVINTWRPGETVWTTHWFKKQLPYRNWDKCVFSNGMFYILSTCGYLGVFDPSKAFWNILPVKPCPAFSHSVTRLMLTRMSVLMTEHEGDIFVIYTHFNSNPTVFKLNLKQNVWEEKRDLGGLTVFASFPASFTRAGLSAEERNRIYTSYIDKYGRYGMYYSLGDAKSSYPPPRTVLTNCITWAEPPHNNVNV